MRSLQQGHWAQWCLVPLVQIKAQGEEAPSVCQLVLPAAKCKGGAGTAARCWGAGCVHVGVLLCVCLEGVLPTPESAVKWPSPSALAAPTASRGTRGPQTLPVPRLPGPRPHRGSPWTSRSLTHGLWRFLACFCSHGSAAVTCFPFYLKTGAESALNHKTAQRGSWQLTPVDPNPWSLWSCKGPAKRRFLGREPATPHKSPWGVTWLYQQGTFLQLSVTLRHSTDNSALGAVAGYQVPNASSLLL